ncbi:energy transducer TonB [Polymorphobacter megasporae]|uniref:energy transducer TonB n=1 Tax=Glacieibacterium megasporae TaxID=2835787 RepID=UPI001C1E4EB5|nr:energy transducer TonB [Polymorphobacter megasporae]UAJ11701.1 energy transducer TonB [Polymorphobacter megasporae]
MLLLAGAAAVATAMMPVPVKKWVVDIDQVARAASREGSAARVEVTIDSTGQPVHCEVTLPDKAAGFNRAACHVLMRGPRLTPGRDADGNPIAAVLRYDFNSTSLRNPRVRPSKIKAAHDTEAKRGRDAGQRTVDFAIPVSRLPKPGRVLPPTLSPDR